MTKTVQRTAYIALTFDERTDETCFEPGGDAVDRSGAFTEQGLQDYIEHALRAYHTGHAGRRGKPWIADLKVVLLPSVTESK